MPTCKNGGFGARCRCQRRACLYQQSLRMVTAPAEPTAGRAAIATYASPRATHLPHPHVAGPGNLDGVVASLGEVRPQQRVPAGGGVQRVGVCVGGQRPSTMCGIEGQRWRCAPPNAQWGIPGCAGQSRGWHGRKAMQNRHERHSRKLDGQLLHAAVLNGGVKAVHVAHPAGPHYRPGN